MFGTYVVIAYLCGMNFKIKYDYGALTDKEIIVKNVNNQLHAKIKLNTWLESKHGKCNLKIYSCVEDWGLNINEIFGGIFK
jgi:hypothetical protein